MVTILFENESYLVCIKPPMTVSENTPKKDGLADILAERNGGYIGVIHRMDRGVGGVTVYAKTPTYAAKLSREVQEHRLGKEYLAFLSGVPEKEEGELRDWLYFDRKKNKVFPVKKERNGVKEAILTYRVIKTLPIDGTDRQGALVSVAPVTGRTHQIRVQFASRGLPIVGDRKYGDRTVWKSEGIGLCCHSITVEGKTYELSNLPWKTVE